MGAILDVVFSATSTSDRDRKELLGTLLAEVTISVDRADGHAHFRLDDLPRLLGVDGNGK